MSSLSSRRGICILLCVWIVFVLVVVPHPAHAKPKRKQGRSGAKSSEGDLEKIFSELQAGGRKLQESNGSSKKQMQYWRKAIKQHPDLQYPYVELANVYMVNAPIDYQQALQVLKQGKSKQGLNDFRYDMAFGDCYRGLKQFDKSIEHYQRFVREARTSTNPHMKAKITAVLRVLNEQYSSLGRFAEALDVLSQAISLDPQSTQPQEFIKLSYASARLQRPKESLRYLEEGLKIHARDARLHHEYGVALYNNEKPNEAVDALQGALKIEPGRKQTICVLAFALKSVCRLREWLALFPTVKQIIDEDLHATADKPSNMCIGPAEANFYPLPLSTVSQVLQNFGRLEAQNVKTMVQGLSPPLPIPLPRTASSITRDAPRMKIAIVSPDFRDHVVAELMTVLFQKWDRSKFESHCYSLFHSTGKSFRQELQRNCDHWYDVERDTPVELAHRINQQGIHIVIDAAGWTARNRIGLFSLRPAPVSLLWLGFPGTTGTQYVDYVLTDNLSTPPEYAPWYSEKTVYHPSSWLINQHKATYQEVLTPEYKPTRTDFGLPEKAFIFGNFGQFLKIDALVFDAWMRILRRVPNSVMYFLRVTSIGGDAIVANLRAEAHRAGIDPNRLMFQNKILKGKHMLVEQLVDVALDTTQYTGGVTSLDMAWAAVPFVSMPGDRLASRISAPILYGMGVSELLVGSIKEYEDLAVALANDPARLARIRSTMESNRLTSPIFDTVRWIRSFEDRLQSLWELHEALRSLGRGDQRYHIF